MSASIEYEDEDRGVLLTCTGDVNSDDVIAINSLIHEQGRLVQLRYYILDLNNVESVDVSADKLRYLAEQFEFALEIGTNLKIAVVSTHDVVNSLIQMWCTYLNEGTQLFQQFGTLSEARSWINEIPDKQMNA